MNFCCFHEALLYQFYLGAMELLELMSTAVSLDKKTEIKRHKENFGKNTLKILKGTMLLTKNNLK